MLNFRPSHGKNSSSGDSTKNRNFGQIYFPGQRLGSSNKQNRSSSKEDKDKNPNKSFGKDKFVSGKSLIQQNVLLGKAQVTNAKGQRVTSYSRI